ncbi:MAG: hypothetical protein F6K24_14485 [Okeania sp. SIO2D1]|nr:hypothetical protein [Okeania sp. SIO2D1]
MLHLAKVQKNTSSGKMELQLLACQGTDSLWSVCDDQYIAIPEINLTEAPVLNEGIFVLVDLDQKQEITSIKEAEDWILGLVETYLSKSYSVDWFKEETARMEKWRHELTLESQELTRRNLELETRQDQIQDLEKNLKREKEELEGKLKDVE